MPKLIVEGVGEFEVESGKRLVLARLKTLPPINCMPAEATRDVPLAGWSSWRVNRSG